MKARMKTLALHGLLMLVMLACSPAVQRSMTSSRSKETSSDDRQITYHAHVTLRLLEPDSLNKALPEFAKKYDGYALTLGDNTSSIRVSSARLREALDGLAHYGKITQKNITGEDITEDHEDATIRLENAEKARQRYLQLLEKAETVEAAVKVEKELERLNGEIDQLKSKLDRQNHLLAYSTVTITLEKKYKTGILGYPLVWSYKAVRWLFVRNS
ncbi:DUF4349 domain-containing protein [Chryseolinea lacunae]|uniref:DUF4349 domain-containing protein n=1 Tax=Chryseolinea lacunae TaxID=2801331 RepID=A0ABS1KSJ4_9BACT|nr:DUF4349 domain-containing protein [Chryseolinea lacunae]MBL0742168.1 DUF4349 domain-containing protein [Chryseolinea lacunae]